jgi:hypothetical protein
MVWQSSWKVGVGAEGLVAREDDDDPESDDDDDDTAPDPPEEVAPEDEPSVVGARQPPCTASAINVAAMAVPSSRLAMTRPPCHTRPTVCPGVFVVNRRAGREAACASCLAQPASTCSPSQHAGRLVPPKKDIESWLEGR